MIRSAMILQEGGEIGFGEASIVLPLATHCIFNGSGRAAFDSSRVPQNGIVFQLICILRRWLIGKLCTFTFEVY